MSSQNEFCPDIYVTWLENGQCPAVISSCALQNTDHTPKVQLYTSSWVVVVFSSSLVRNIASRKRRRSSSETSAAKRKVGFCTTCKQDFTWHEPVNAAAGTVVGVLCSLCKRHHRRLRNIVETWTKKPRTLRKHHKESSMHKGPSTIAGLNWTGLDWTGLEWTRVE